MTSLSTAADVWQEWVRLGVIRPQDYDADVVEALTPLIGGAEAPASTVADRLRSRDVTVRDLVRAVTPLLTSFAGMVRDLLRLYTRVGAQHATGENLRMEYEYEDGHVVDESLAAFREHVASAETAVALLPSLVFDPTRAWQGPGSEYREVESEFSRTVDGSYDPVMWDDTLPPPPATGRPDVDDVLAQWWTLLQECTRLIAAVADDYGQLRAWLYSEPEDVPRHHIDLGWAATDFWPVFQMHAAHGLAESTRQGKPPSLEELAALREWLDSFWQETPTEISLDALADIFSMPMWGRRHELYAAWILTQLDRALPGRLHIELVDGALRFPFSPTRLATLQAADLAGRSCDIELWSEFRTPAHDLVGSGRRRAVQPDYQFRRAATTDAAGVVLAVEVKQYLRSALRNPRDALRDYAVNLPTAHVALVAHGPLSPRVLESFAPTIRDRVSAFPYVRPTEPARCREFRAAVAAHLPPPPPAPAEPPRAAAAPTAARAGSAALVTLTWSPAVHDLDLHARREDTDERISYANLEERWGRLHDDAVNGGPEQLTLHPTGGRIRVTVRVYDGPASLRDAGAAVEVAVDGSVARLAPARGVSSEWTVGELTPEGRFVPGAETIISP
ncbi:hypothetical protein [Georgenia satyanarayanai]|uniref:hypothetical protein n=1 Tax=Georgenia satyanarayanai TaxID=860221 RepID=UPI0012652E29|nr:hypothetical protein [Georgenia satyanarayanai]